MQRSVTEFLRPREIKVEEEKPPERKKINEMKQYQSKFANFGTKSKTSNDHLIIHPNAKLPWVSYKHSRFKTQKKDT